MMARDILAVRVMEATGLGPVAALVAVDICAAAMAEAETEAKARAMLSFVDGFITGKCGAA